MGERSNIVIVQPDNSRIFLYGHWMGEDNFKIAGEVLSRKQRWADHAYLARMLFEKMIEGSFDKETGFGISNSMPDNEYPIVVINPGNQTVHLEQYNWSDSSFSSITPLNSFEAFVEVYSFSESSNDLAVNMGAKLTPA